MRYLGLLILVSVSVASCAEEAAAPAGGTTETSTFVCDDGSEISADFECDGDLDCADDSDEAYCGTGATFLCDDGSEIEAAFECDGDLDCTDGSDEANCQ